MAQSKRPRTPDDRPLNRVKADIVRTLRRLRRIEGRERTAVYRELAEHLVALRERYLTDEGEPDWIGRTDEYRHTVSELYSTAGYAHEEAKGVQSSIRYHVGNVVREILKPEEIEDLGIDEVSPLERAREKRSLDADVLQRARRLLADHPELLKDYPDLGPPKE